MAAVQTSETRERGAVAIEFALLLPVLLAFVLGVIEFGLAFNAQISVTSAAREGARVLALGGDQAEVAARVNEAAPSLDPNLISVSATAPCVPGQPSAVVVTYAYDTLFYWGNDTWTLTGSGDMRCGG